MKQTKNLPLVSRLPRLLPDLPGRRPPRPPSRHHPTLQPQSDSPDSESKEKTITSSAERSNGVPPHNQGLRAAGCGNGACICRRPKHLRRWYFALHQKKALSERSEFAFF